jgi:hypothetical protein
VRSERWTLLRETAGVRDLHSQPNGNERPTARCRHRPYLWTGRWLIPLSLSLGLAWSGLTVGVAGAADTVPTDIQQPGTQPNEVGNLEAPDKCDNCHGGYNSSVEPAHNWRGSMMAHAGRDPIFWATLAIAEQDFDGAGDLCIRCHSTGGWLAGRSTPTDGSGLAAGDSDGVECDFCHKLTNPDDSEWLGVMNAPFIANDLGDPPVGYYASGMASLWGGSDKLGPYPDAEARHQFLESRFHRSVDFCGTCHDVSNPAVGNLAPGHGTQPTADPVIADGVLGGPVDGKAAFNNFPYQYGIVERTFSEYKSGLISQTLVSDYPNLPPELQGGALQAVYEAAIASGANGNYADGAPRYFSCQTCHMRPVEGAGCNKRGAPVRSDLPLHDMTGGNYWMPQAIQYLDGLGKLRLGGGLTETTRQAMDDGALRAQQQLALAASLDVSGHKVKIVNHTGHKLISGYPEGRRMWLNIKWYDAAGQLLREDGEYGALDVDLDGDGVLETTVQTLLDLDGTNTKIYEAHMGMTKAWAEKLVALNSQHYAPIVLSYDRVTGASTYTLGELADPSNPDAYHETFHFVLNDTVIKDNRIPPYGMDYEEARKRNALPVPDSQYGGPGGTYDHFDEVTLSPPSGADHASIDLLYQPTSWEYIQFLYLGNDGGNAFLADEGTNMLDAWLNTGMAAPYTMASATWRADPVPCGAPVPTLLAATAGDKQVSVAWQEITGIAGYRLYYDQAGKAQRVADLAAPASSYVDSGLTNGQEYCYKLSSYDATCESGFSAILCAVPQAPGQIVNAGVDRLETGKYVKSGKGKNATVTFEPATTFAPGDGVVIRAYVVDEGGAPLADAVVELTISAADGSIVATLTTAPTDAAGMGEATWQTEAPNKKGQGGTPPGAYAGSTANVAASGYVWDGLETAIDFAIQ